MNKNNNTDRYHMSISVPKEMGQQLQKLIENDPEMNDSRFARIALRKELERRDGND